MVEFRRRGATFNAVLDQGGGRGVSMTIRLVQGGVHHQEVVVVGRRVRRWAARMVRGLGGVVG